jgi:flagellar protein FliS
MDPRARDSYLEAQVMTATPQKLRLMLIDGALRLARQALQHWEHDRQAEANEAVVRCRAVITELLASVRVNDSALAQRVASVYVYLFRSLTETQAQRDPQRLHDAIRVLEVERETWREVCEKLPHSPMPSQVQMDERREVTTDQIPATEQAGTFSALDGGDGEARSGGLVLDA